MKTPLIKLFVILSICLLQSCNRNSIVVLSSNQLGLEWDQSKTIDMGLISVGSYKSQKFTLQNKSQNTASNCQAVELSDVTNFSVLSTTCGSTMAPNSSCDVVVEASPQSAGFKDLSLRVKCDLDEAPAAPVTRAKVEAVVTDISWSPTSTRNFGSAAISEYAASTYNYTLSNNGSQSVTGCGAVTLSNPTDFEISSDNCTNPSLSASSTCFVSVRAKPMSSGVRYTSITRTCAESGVVSTQLSKTKVTGVTPLLSVFPLNHNFGNVDIGSISNQLFTFSNGSSLATARNCSAPNLSNNTDFILTADSCSTNDLGANASCNINVRAQPQSIGLKTATLSRTCVIGGAVSTTQDQIIVTGVVPTPNLAWSPSSYNFGNTAVGGNSSNQTFYINNSGNAAATSCGLPTISNVSDFTIVNDTCGLNNINPGASCSVVLRANPTSVGVKSTTVSRNCAVGGTVVSNQITNTGVYPVLGSDWKQVQGVSGFYLVNIGSNTTEMDYYFRNLNSQSFTGCEAPQLSSNINFSIASDECGTNNMPAASVCKVRVKAHPIGLGYTSVTLSRRCNETYSSLSLDATGAAAGNIVKINNGYRICALYDNGTVRCQSTVISGITNAVDIVGGYKKSCVILGGADAGKIKCWDEYNWTSYDVPEASDVVQLSVGDNSSCYIDSANKVKCWGAWGHNGEMGNGTSTPNSIPGYVSGVNFAVKVVSAGSHSCALLGGADAGKIKCWGYNYNGQLGDGATYTNKLTPVFVSGISDATDIAAGSENTCALLSNGKVKCWGENTSYRLGLGVATPAKSHTPVEVLNVSNAVKISVGGYGSAACALLGGADAGKVKCWGPGSELQLGDGSMSVGSSAVYVSDLNDVTQITNSSGSSYNKRTCALTSGKVVKCWGGIESFQLNSPVMQAKAEISNALKLALGGTFSCALLSAPDAGKVKCWGMSYYGLGNGDISSYSPVTLADSDIVDIAAGTYHACYVIGGSGVDAGKIKCWGVNTWGQLGNGTTTSNASAVTVSGITNAVKVATGEDFSCAILGGVDAGKVKCWGGNIYGGLLGNPGASAVSTTPVFANNITNAVSIVAGQRHVCVTLGGADAGKAMCWGTNSSNQLGDGTSTDRGVPTLVTEVNNISQLALGNIHTCALYDGGKVKCWGYNGYQQLGNTSSITDAVAVSAGRLFSCVLLGGAQAGKAQCWGSSHGGALGSGLQSASTGVSEYIVNMPAINSLALAGSEVEHNCVISSGQVYCAGKNDRLQAGSITTFIERMLWF